MLFDTVNMRETKLHTPREATALVRLGVASKKMNAHPLVYMKQKDFHAIRSDFLLRF